MTELFYQIALSFIPKIGNKAAQTLIAHCGGAEAVFRESKKNLMKIDQIGSTIADAVCSFHDHQRIEQELKFIDNNNITPHFYLSKNYPKRLKECTDFPMMLYTKGNLNLDSEKMLSIVGTRSATEYGKEMCNQMIHDFAQRNYKICIVSGLAYGIDVAAHRACLNYDIPTIGVVAHGLDQLYPPHHKKVSEQMQRLGGLVSEFTSKTQLSPSLFIRRNRIIAGLCDATLVVESASRGGALYTAEMAQSYGRDVLAVPGRVGDKYSIGCNKIIRNNLAALVENVEDIEYALKWDNNSNANHPVQRKLFMDLTTEEQKIVDSLSNNIPQQIDAICQTTGLTFSRLSKVLLNLELNGVIKLLPGKQYTMIQ